MARVSSSSAAARRSILIDNAPSSASMLTSRGWDSSVLRQRASAATRSPDWISAIVSSKTLFGASRERMAFSSRRQFAQRLPGLIEGPAEDLRQLVDLRTCDDERWAHDQRVANRAHHQPICDANVTHDRPCCALLAAKAVIRAFLAHDLHAGNQAQRANLADE